MSTEESFGSRLRRERERRRIALSSISADTKISASFFEALEREDLSRWPSGIFRRAFIRAYANGIGLDPDAIVKEFYERFPDPGTPSLPASGEPVPAPNAPPATRPPGSPILRLTLTDAGAPFTSGPLLNGMRQRWSAVACDAGVVLAIAISMFTVSGKFWVPLAIVTFAYYLGAILLLGNTPGVSLWGQSGSEIPATLPHAHAAALLVVCLRIFAIAPSGRSGNGINR